MANIVLEDLKNILVTNGFVTNKVVRNIVTKKNLTQVDVWVGFLGLGDILSIGMPKISRLDIINIKCILKVKFWAVLLGACRYK